MSRTFKTLAVAVPVTVLFLAIAVPNFVKSRSVISMNACANNLRCIEGAKKEWAVQHNATNATPTEADLLPFLPGRPATLFPACPSEANTPSDLRVSLRSVRSAELAIQYRRIRILT
jgi:hypothetical protein